MIRTVTALLVAFSAHEITTAQSAASIWVSTRVENQCRVVGGKLDFGTYNPIGLQASQSLDAEAHFEVFCTPGVVAQIYLESGLHAMGDRRRMVASATRDVLEYELYLDPGRTVPWTSAASVSLTQVGQRPRRVPVFGRIPRAQDVAEGDYEDSVLIQVRF